MATFLEEDGDLFELSQEWALAHCVGEDLIMGKGIAVEFKKRYGHVDWLTAQKKHVGETLLLPNTMIDRNVFYLITKKWSKRSKPSYEDIEKCVVDLFLQAKQKKITKIGMPKIGCGLDGKDWNQIKKIIQKHQPNEIKIIVKYK